MNIATIKACLWLGALAAAGYLGYFIYETWQRWPVVEQMLYQDEARQRKVLDSVTEPEVNRRDDLVQYARVESTFTQLDWTGKPPPPPPDPVVEVDEPTEVPKTPVADLLMVLFIQVDTTKPDRSLAYVRYTNPQLAQTVRGAGGGLQSNKPPTAELVPGDHLPSPYQTIYVARIEAEGAVFAFEDDEEREEERVSTSEFEIGPSGFIQQVGPGGAILPNEQSRIETVANPQPFRPERTQLIGQDRYRIGTEDAQDWGDRYSEILTREVSHRQWINPATGKREGIQITSVQPGGVAAAHGAKSGDVVKSINGHPVSSVPEAIQYVKNNAELTTVWEVVVENQGIERTVVYESPAD